MPDRPSNEPASNRQILFNITRTRSGQRMWSDPVQATNRLEFAQPATLAPAHFPHYSKEIAGDRTVTPVAAAVCQDVPLRHLPSTLATHYRNGGAHPINNSKTGHLNRHYNSNIISSIHDSDLYEDDQHGYGTYANHSVPRLMRQAPKLLSLDDYNLISLGYKPVCPCSMQLPLQ